MDPFIGEIRPFPYNFAPLGWLYCDGSLQQISDYDVLYNLLGTTYGGDGVTTFGLPDLRGRTPRGSNGGAGLGQQGGSETVVLQTPQIGAHTHTLAVSNAGTSASPVNAHPGAATDPVYDETPNASLNAGAIVPSLTVGLPHDNVQPYLAVAFCISTQGIYPSQQ